MPFISHRACTHTINQINMCTAVIHFQVDLAPFIFQLDEYLFSPYSFAFCIKELLIYTFVVILCERMR